MRRQAKRKCRELRNQAIHNSDPRKALDVLLALDRMVVEVSMCIYNLPRSDRFKMREQNRRLHGAVREYLPRLRERSRSPI